MEQKKTFEPFEKVIFKREHLGEKWTCGEFSHVEDEYYVLAGNQFFKIEDTDILPFADNEHLVGTSDMPEEEVELKDGEFIIASSDKDTSPEKWTYTQYNGTTENEVKGNWSCFYSFCVPYDKFNPHDMEETRKHILCVKDGKLVKARV